MMGRKDMKQETMAKRTRNKAMADKMVSPRKKMDMGMSPGAGMGAASAPPMAPMAMKKGGMAKKPAGFAKGGMAKKGMKSGGMMLVIGLGKKKGK